MTTFRTMTIIKALLQYTKSVLSTKAVASYVLETMYTYHSKVYSPKSLLYLTHIEHGTNGDYMTDLLLHGFKTLLGIVILHVHFLI